MEITEEKINELIESGKIEEALRLQELLYLKQLSKYINNLIEQNELEEALKICEQYEENEVIQSQRITILIKLFRYNEALTICKREEYINNPSFMQEAAKIEKMLHKKTGTNNFKVDTNSLKLKSNILTRIYCGDINLNEIQTQELDEWTKLLLTIAYSDKNNKKYGINIIKEWKKKNITEEQLKILNILLERLLNKKNIIYDYSYYGKLLGCYLDQNIVSQLFKKEQEEREVANKKITIIPKKQTIKKQKTPTAKIVIVEGKKKETKKTVSPIVINKKEAVPVASKKERVEPSISNLLIKDLFKDEVLEIGTYLYVQMRDVKIQALAVDAWDRFECLINKPVSDKEALKRMVSLLKRVENSPSVSISVDDKRYTKYLSN